MLIINSLYNLVFFNVLRIFDLNDIHLPVCILVLLIGYIYFTFKLRFIQFRRLKECICYTFNIGKNKNKREKGSISSIKTLFTSVASCTGMNATAGMVFVVAVGGPGTIFWFPFIVFFCMALRFAEVYLSHSLRTQKRSETIGGPFDYFRKGFEQIGYKKIGQILAVIYAFLMITSGVVGVSMYEMSQSVAVVEKSFAFLNGKRLLITSIFTIIAIVILVGGTKRVMNVFSVVLPVLSIIYLCLSIIVIAVHYDKIVDTFILIYQDAWHPRTLAGGFVASFCMCSRKLSLANETGLGTAGLVHSSSSETDSIKEATCSMLTPIINGLLVCFISAFVIAITGIYKTEYVNDGAFAFAKVFGDVVPFFSIVILLMIPIMAFNVLIGWCNYILKCVKFIYDSRVLTAIVAILFLCFSFAGGLIDDFVFVMNVVDTMVMMILFINIPAVIILSNIVAKAVKNYDFKNCCIKKI